MQENFFYKINFPAPTIYVPYSLLHKDRSGRVGAHLNDV